jgi:hypothetical protein
LPKGQHLTWRLDVPLVVVEHKRLEGPPKTEVDRFAVEWHEMQADLASRSKFGRLIEAGTGHVIAVEQPEIVIESIRQVIEQAQRRQ